LSGCGQGERAMSNVVFQIKYVAKKPPQNLTAEQKVAYMNERKFFDWTAEFNHAKYILDDKKVEKNRNFGDYATRQGNLGLFDCDKTLTQKEIETVKTSLQNTDSHIWHGFISFDEETSKHFQTQEQAMHFLRQHFMDFLDRTHLDKKNINLVAALHKDTEHRHIHFSFWEKEPQHIDKHGQVGFSTKGNFSQNVIDNWLVSANMAVGAKDELYSSRDAVILKLREMKAASGREFTDKEVQLKLLSLARKFPNGGRLSYTSENMKELRPEIDRIANIVLCGNPELKEMHQKFLRVLLDRDNKVAQIKKDNKIKSDIEYINKLTNDYKARVGNMIIGLDKEMKREYFAGYHKQSDKQKKVAARKQREHANRVYANFTGKLIKSLGQIHKNMEAEFTGTVKDAERLLQYELYMDEMRGAV
jgi:hypothetical protein